MESSKTKIISIVTTIAFLLMVIGATYAYFAAQTGEGASTDIKLMLIQLMFLHLKQVLQLA